MREECKQCHHETINGLIHKFDVSLDVAEAFREHANRIFNQDTKLSNPMVATLVQRLAKEQLNQGNLYHQEKSRANRMVYSQYQNWRQRVRLHDNPFALAAKLAVVGNIIDYGAHTVPDDIPEAIEQLVNKSLKIDQRTLLQERIKNAKNILYLGDNAGEIVFDKLLIQHLHHDNVTFVVRGKPVLNDATLEDARQIGMEDVCEIIENGSDAPSTLLNECSQAFNDAFEKADLIIAKGMGNFEGLMHQSDPRIFFLLMAKCNPIAKLLGVSRGDMVITQFL